MLIEPDGNMIVLSTSDQVCVFLRHYLRHVIFHKRTLTHAHTSIWGFLFLNHGNRRLGHINIQFSLLCSFAHLNITTKSTRYGPLLSATRTLVGNAISPFCKRSLLSETVKDLYLSRTVPLPKSFMLQKPSKA